VKSRSKILFTETGNDLRFPFVTFYAMRVLSAGVIEKMRDFANDAIYSIFLQPRFQLFGAKHFLQFITLKENTCPYKVQIK
jgi:hypothetical protein